MKVNIPYIVTCAAFEQERRSEYETAIGTAREKERMDVWQGRLSCLYNIQTAAGLTDGEREAVYSAARICRRLSRKNPQWKAGDGFLSTLERYITEYDSRCMESRKMSLFKKLRFTASMARHNIITDRYRKELQAAGYGGRYFTRT